MDRNAKEERQQAHALLDMLSDDKINALRTLLEVMVDSTARESLAEVPTDEEELAPETAAAIERARASLAHGRRIPHDDVLREFGFKK